MNLHQQRIAALGFFDGVHRGHQAILRMACDVAGAKGIPSAVITFREHPRTITEGKSPGLIMSYDTRINFISRQGVGEVIVLPFDHAMAETAPGDFIRLLADRYGVVSVVCGENFRFGSRAMGNPETFRTLGMAVYPCPSVREGGQVISATAIRSLVAEGELAQAATLLGRPFFINETVEKGTQTGRRIGFPTANISIPKGQLIPARGVYVTTVHIGGSCYPAVTNVGSRPTFAKDDILTVESHLPGFEGNLYGMECRVDFLRFLRPEGTFANGQTLAAQIEEDIKQAMHIHHQEM